MKLGISIYGNTFLQKQLLVVCKNLSSKHLFTYFTYWKNDTVKVTFSSFIYWLKFVWNDGEEDEDFYSTLPLVVNLQLAWTYYTLILLFFLSCGYFTQQTCWKSTTEVLEKSVKYVQSQQKKTPERRHWCCSGVFIARLIHISHIFLVFSLLTLNRYMFTV